ncbi:MAG: type II toxin-antitoxin system HicB family antitoxin [Clostridiales bacterium]|jgi:predicted RNase H-like HicB family nuclease|nr:type II toxin-antitoxin system HicB family antitoxin [Clostridiales bacterium]
MNKSLEYYMKLPYSILIVEDEDDGGYVGACPELPGCLTYADTIEEAIKMIADAKEVWLTSSLQDGQNIPEPNTFKTLAMLQNAEVVA